MDCHLPCHTVSFVVCSTFVCAYGLMARILSDVSCRLNSRVLGGRLSPCARARLCSSPGQAWAQLSATSSRAFCINAMFPTSSTKHLCKGRGLVRSAQPLISCCTCSVAAPQALDGDEADKYGVQATKSKIL